MCLSACVLLLEDLVYSLFGVHVQYWSLLNLQKLRLRCGCVAVPVNFDIIPSFFAKFKNVVHSFDPGETRRLVWVYTFCICPKVPFRMTLAI